MLANRPVLYNGNMVTAVTISAVFLCAKSLTKTCQLSVEWLDLMNNECVQAYWVNAWYTNSCFAKSPLKII